MIPSRTTTRGVFTSPASMASFRPKSDTIQSNKPSSVLVRPVGAKGVADMSKQRAIRNSW